MSLILLAITAAIVVCVVAYCFAIYTLPFMVGLTAFQWAWAAEHVGLRSRFINSSSRTLSTVSIAPGSAR